LLTTSGSHGRGIRPDKILQVLSMGH